MKRTTSLLFFLFSLVLIVFLQVQSPLAQTTGRIIGVVEDETAAVLPGVTISATNIDTNLVRTVISDDEGRYRLVELPVGAYEIQAQLAGFRSEVRSSITLTIAGELAVNFTLQVGGLEERVLVTGEAALVETSSALMAGLVDAKKIRDLPLNGRDFAQLALLSEGVVQNMHNRGTQPGNEGVKLSLAGTRQHQTAFLLDGTDIRNHMGGVPAGAAGTVSGVETIREFKVITSVYSAEYGRFSGGVITAVTKSGTNEVHGSIYEYHRNSALDARNFFDIDAENPTVRSKPPAFIRHQFGFSLGAPIVKDKTFLFTGYEGFRQNLTTTRTFNVPTALARQGILPTTTVTVPARMDPVLALFPMPNGQDLGGGVAEYIVATPSPRTQNVLTVRIDHQISDSDSFFGRYTFDDSNRQRVVTLITDAESDYRYQYLTLSHKKIISPNLINELKFGWTRSKANQLPSESVPIDPALRFSRQSSPLFGRIVATDLSSIGAFIELTQFPENYQYSNDLSWSRGNHFLKLGAHYTRFHYNHSILVRAHGFYVVGGLERFLQGISIRFDGFLTESYIAGMRQNLFGFYVQDDWKYKPRLSFNLGLRYEFINAPNEVGTGESVGLPEVQGRVSNLENILDPEQHVGNPYFKNPSLKSFSPRIGFAWDVFGNAKTSLRGGFGIFYDHILSNVYQGSPVFNTPFALKISTSAFGMGRPRFIPIGEGIDPYENANLLPTAWAIGDPKQSYVMQFSLNLQQEIFPDTVLSLAYQGSQGRHLGRLTNDNNLATPVKYDDAVFAVAGAGAEFNGRTYFPDGGVRRNPNFSGVRMELWDANSFYNSFKFGLNKRFSEGLQFQVSYTNAAFIDDSSNLGHYDTAGDLSSMDPDDRTASRGWSAGHIRHSFLTNFGYDLPIEMQGLAGTLLGGWHVNGIFSAASGPARGIEVSFDRANSLQSEIEQRPEAVAGFSNNPVLSDGRDPNAYFDVDAFTLPPEGFWGNVGRNTLIGPGILTFDLGLNKDFSLHEEVTLQFRAEMFNLLNRANFSLPSSTIFTNAGGNPSPSAGRITSTTTTSRQVQFALKIVF